MLQNILVDIIIYEHDAPRSGSGEMLVHLGDRLKQFDQYVQLIWCSIIQAKQVLIEHIGLQPSANSLWTC